MLVEVEDGVYDRLGFVDDLHQIEIRGVDEAVVAQLIGEPLQQPRPELGTHQNDRQTPALPGLDQGERLEQFVHRAKAAGHDHVGRSVFHEGHLPGKEMPEPEADVLIRVGQLLGGQVDIQADAGAGAGMGTLVASLHDARAAARNDAEAGVGEPASDLESAGIVGIVGFDAGTAEYAHGRAHLGQLFGGLVEL